jgi:protein Tex
MNHAEQIARPLNLKPAQITAVVELLDAGNTLPFVARYRKEATGGLDEEQLRQIAETVTRLRNLDERRQTILTTIESQEKLTPALRRQILAAATLTALEDLYQPYKPKRRTRATMARERGLQPLADLILAQPRGGPGTGQLTKPFLSANVPSMEEALAGARDIVAEIISDHPNVRGRLRDKAMRWGLLRCRKIESSADPRRLYELYYAYEMRVDRLRPHQVLAINRGEKEKVLRVQVSLADRDWQEAVTAVFRSQRQSPLAEQLHQAAADAAQRLLLPAIERDARRALTTEAESHAISVFAANLRGLLSQPPLAGYTILAIDPGFRTGCKVAIVDATGKALDSATIYPHEPQKRRDEALRTLAGLVNAHKASLVAIGNGTASRETEQLVAELINERQQDLAINAELHYLMVNEAGASVYSASPLARAELPGLDVSMRGAVSIARRVQDPLAELVKIDPKSIGVGLYQHDVNQSRLAAALDSVVESVVNNVGVDANTASPALLRYVAGIGPKIAERMVAYRNENGPFTNRRALLKVPGLGPKAFEQAAGFLRIRDGDNPLDAGAIHPESYPVAEAVLRQAGLSPQTPAPLREVTLAKWRAQRPLTEVAAALGTGMPTLADILEQLVRPGRDPRADLPPPLLRHDVLSMDDLRPGMRLQGTVRNVVDFGAFVDIGVKQDGLLHRSRLPRGTALNVGDVLDITVLNVEPERGRISLAWAGAD